MERWCALIWNLYCKSDTQIGESNKDLDTDIDTIYI